MRIAITGATGQLGRAFKEVAEADHDLVLFGGRTGPDGIDLRDASGVQLAIVKARPDWILHAAAMTDVDGCERDPEAAHLANALGTQAVARAAARVGARMVAVSTDYVFDGSRGDYRETDATHPCNVYGRSKLEGERLAAQELPDLLVARTSVLFGPHKKNFVSWVRQELVAGRGIRIASDQRVTPTLSYDLADQLMSLMRADEAGIFHTAGATALTRLQMAHAIADHFGLQRDLIASVRTDELPWVARRPGDATLNTAKVSRFKQPLAFPDALRRLEPVPA